MLESDLKEAIRLGNVQRAQIEHLQSLQARQATPISPPPLGMGGEATAEAAEGPVLQEHFNALLQVLSRHCLNNSDYIVEQEQARATEVIFLNSDYIANVQGQRAESARLAFELQQARQINVQLADLQQQQIERAEEARQQSNALLQVLSRGYLDDIIASLSLSRSLSLSPPLARSLSHSLSRALSSSLS